MLSAIRHSSSSPSGHKPKKKVHFRKPLEPVSFLGIDDWIHVDFVFFRETDKPSELLMTKRFHRVVMEHHIPTRECRGKCKKKSTCNFRQKLQKFLLRMKCIVLPNEQRYDLLANEEDDWGTLLTRQPSPSLLFDWIFQWSACPRASVHESTEKFSQKEVMGAKQPQGVTLYECNRSGCINITVALSCKPHSERAKGLGGTTATRR